MLDTRTAATRASGEPLAAGTFLRVPKQVSAADARALIVAGKAVDWTDKEIPSPPKKADGKSDGKKAE